MSGEVSDAALDGADAEVEAQGGLSADLDWGAVVEAAAAAAGTAACAAYGAGPAAPLCGFVASEIAGFVMDTVIPAIADAWDSIFGSAEPEPSLIGPLSDDQKWAGLWRSISSEEATSLPVSQAILAMMRAASSVAGGGAWTTETIVGYLQDCGAGFEWRTGLSLDNRRFSGFEELCLYPEGPGTPCVWQTVPKLSIVSEKPRITSGLWVPDFVARYRAKHPFANDWQTLLAFYNAEVAPWWDHFYNVALPCLTTRLQADAIAFKAQTAAAVYQSEQLAQIAALPPGDRQALEDWAELSQLSPEDAERMRQWAELAKLSPEEREQLRALQAFAELSPNELAKLKAVAAVTGSRRDFGLFGAVAAAPIGAMPA